MNTKLLLDNQDEKDPLLRHDGLKNLQTNHLQNHNLNHQSISNAISFPTATR